MIKAFIDYQNRVPHRIFIPEKNEVYRMPDKELINFLKKMNVEELYIEGAPKEWINNLLLNGIRVYILRIRNHKEWRRKHSMKKSHENDTKLLYLLYKENPELFREYVRRQLYDPDVQRYKLLLREVRRVRQKITINQKLGLSVDKLKEYEVELVREINRLYYRLKKKYSGILEKFNIKGLAGELLYFLTLIPDVRSFRSTRSFLIYLGLRATPPRKAWNREARDALIKIAMKVAKYNGTKFNPKKPNWKYIRKVALLIFEKLREESGAE